MTYLKNCFKFKKTCVFFAFFFISIAGLDTAIADVNVDNLNNPAQEKPAAEQQIGEKLISLLGASEQPAIVGEGQPYTLGKEDVLKITVRNQREFSGKFVIGPDGKIQYSFVGDIKAEGFTKEELKEKLVEELMTFVKVPEVSIAIIAYNSKNVYILGEVSRPGKYPMKGDVISLRDGIVAAGLPTREAALRKVHIIKFNDSKEPVCEKINVYTLLYQGNLENNLDLVSGDIVVIPSTFLSKINRALNSVLSPVSKGVAAGAMF